LNPTWNSAFFCVQRYERRGLADCSWRDRKERKNERQIETVKAKQRLSQKERQNNKSKSFQFFSSTLMSCFEFRLEACLQKSIFFKLNYLFNDDVA
jgi:hypothetical protein